MKQAVENTVVLRFAEEQRLELKIGGLNMEIIWFLGILILLVIIVVVVTVAATVAGTAAAVEDEESLEE